LWGSACDERIFSLARRLTLLDRLERPPLDFGAHFFRRIILKVALDHRLSALACMAFVTFTPLCFAQSVSPAASPSSGLVPHQAMGVENTQVLTPLQHPTPAELRLEQIKVEKAQIEKNFEQKNLACLNKFAVTGCKLDVLAEKNELLSPLKKEEAQISQEQKRLRSEQKLQEISLRESPEELERVREKAKIAQDAYEERMKAHAERWDEHERLMNAQVSPSPALSPEERAVERQSGVKNAQAIHDEKLKNAIAHRQDQRQRLATKTLHPKPLPVPEISKSIDPPRSVPSP
jgi:colicin import membrane protein